MIDRIIRECKERFKDGDIIKDSWGDTTVVDWGKVESDCCDVWISEYGKDVYLYDSDKHGGELFAEVIKKADSITSGIKQLNSLLGLNLGVNRTVTFMTNKDGIIESYEIEEY